MGHAVGLSAVVGAEMRLVLGLWPLLALTLTLTSLSHLSNAATPFPQDLEPISIVGSECEYDLYIVNYSRNVLLNVSFTHF